MKIIYFALALVCLSLLAACGGGGGRGPSVSEDAPSGSMMTEDTDPTMTEDGNGGTTPAPIRTQAAAIVEAAQNEPRAGSVTQSSDAGISNITNDVVKVTITRSGGGSLDVAASYNGQVVVSTTNATEASDVEDVLNRPKGTRLYERVEQGQSVEFYRSLSTNDIRESDGTAVPAGDLWVDVYTDYTNDDDTDYLAGGIWVYVPDGAMSLDDYEYGAFVDGNDPFSQSSLVGLTGTAVYDGEATGVYVDDQNYFFDATATLTASFGDNSALGTIEGRIYDVEIDGQPVSGNPQLMLGNTDIGNSDSGFFKGNTSMTFDGDTYAGKWGGQFYSNDGTNAPGSVAGTFGGAASDGSRAVLGSFGAFK